MPAGRPPKFDTPEQLEELSSAWWEQVTKDNSGEIPDIEGWAIYLDTTRKTLFEYEKKELFSNTIKYWKDKIFWKKKQLALSGKLNPAIFIFDAINNTDYRNKTEQDVTSGGDKLQPMLVKFVGEDTKN